MGSRGRADEDRYMVSVIKERLAVGEYSIDPQAVAAAMLARCDETSALGGYEAAQRPPLASVLWSQVLVAAQSLGGDAGERETLAGHDPA